jgi:hypothetical protein
MPLGQTGGRTFFYVKNKTRAWDVAQAIEYLTSKHETLSPNPSFAKRKNKTKNKESPPKKNKESLS